MSNSKNNLNENYYGNQNWNNEDHDPAHADQLIRALLTGNKAQALDLIYEYNCINTVGTRGCTPLTALLIGSILPPDVLPTETQEEMLELLFDYGVDVNRIDGNGNVPMFTALMADVPVAHTFFQSNDIDFEQRRGGINLLMAAASEGLQDIVEFIYRDFNLNDQDNSGNTVFHYALFATRSIRTRMDQSDPGIIVETLCAIGADSTLANNEDVTPLDLAYQFHAYDIALTLKRCLYPPSEGFHIRIQIRQTEPPRVFYVYPEDEIIDIKRAIFYENFENFDFYFKGFHNETKRIMEDERIISDYGMRADDLIEVRVKLRTGQGGKRKTRKHRKN